MTGEMQAGSLRSDGLSGTLFGVEVFAEAVADKVEGQHGQSDCNAGKEQDVRRDAEILPGFFDHRSPTRSRRRYAQAEK